MARRNLVVDSSDDSDHDSDHAEAQDVAHLVDVEAEESSDRSDSDSDDLSSETEDGLLDLEAEDSKYAPFSPIDSSALESFPQFARLPPELRQRVWEFFCPELTNKYGRVVPVCAEIFDLTGKPHWLLTDRTTTLEQQTEPIRILAAVHHESRDLVVKRFPDTLPLHAGSDGDAEVRFNGDRDIIAIEFDHRCPIIELKSDVRRSAGPGVCDNVRHIAFNLIHPYVHDGKAIIVTDFCQGMLDMLIKFPKAETAYVWVDCFTYPVNTRWTGTSFARHYYLQTYEEEPGLGEDTEWIFCWPDTVKHPDFSKYNVIEPFRREVSEEYVERFDAIGVKFAPLVSFNLDRGMDEYDRLFHENLSGMPVDEDDYRELSEDEVEIAGYGPNTGYDTGLDEYESEGIDDSEIIEEEESSEDEVIPQPLEATDTIVLDDSSDDNDDEVIPPRRRQRVVGSPTSLISQDEPVGGASSRGRKRRIVSDSDDDDSDGVQPAPKRARTGNVASAARNEDSNDSDESSDESKSQSGSSDDSDDEDDDDDVPPPRLSLAERLRQFRDDNPIPSDEEGSSGGVSDESEDDEEDEEEDDAHGGFIDDMAEDSEEESDESDEE